MQSTNKPPLLWNGDSNVDTLRRLQLFNDGSYRISNYHNKLVEIGCNTCIMSMQFKQTNWIPY